MTARDAELVRRLNRQGYAFTTTDKSDGGECGVLVWFGGQALTAVYGGGPDEALRRALDVARRHGGG